MRSLPAGPYLVEFEANRKKEPLPQLSFAKRAAGEMERQEICPRKAASEAYERGLADGESRGEVAKKEALELLRAELDFQYRREREALVVTTLNKIVSDLQSQWSHLEDRIVAPMARTVAAIVETSAKQKSINELIDKLQELVKDSNIADVYVSVPTDMMPDAKLAFEKLGLTGLSIAEGDAEIRLELNETIIETRLQPWIDQLKEIAQ